MKAIPAPELITDLVVDGSTITVRFDRDLARAFLREDFFVEYEGVEGLAELDRSLLAVPALLNILPVVWASGREYRVESMDEELYSSLEEMRSGFAEMLPGIAWEGRIHPERLVTPVSGDPVRDGGRMAILFSGGLDSTYTSLAHRERKQLLISIWGPDVALDNPEGWRGVQRTVDSFAQTNGHEVVWARSNMRGFLNEPRLNDLSPDLWNWWQQVQHGPGFIGVAVPVAQLLGYPLVVLSSGRTLSQHYTVGAGPDLEGRLRWSGGRAVHFGESLLRHDKLRELVSFYPGSSSPRPALRVCFMYPYGGGGNCGRCEKCLRTMTALIVEGVDPGRYGFEVTAEVALRRVRQRFSTRMMAFGEVPEYFWSEIQGRAQEILAGDASTLGHEVRDFLSWFVSFDLAGYERGWKSIGRVRSRALRLVRRSPRVARWLMRRMASFSRSP